MRAITPLLLCLLSTVVDVDSQIAPYLTITGNNIPNNSYVHLNTVDLKVENQQLNTLNCHTDLNTCCSIAQGPDRGDWYFPNGNRLPFNNYKDPPILLEGRCFELVVMYYESKNGTFAISGVYRCDIETIAVNNNTGTSLCLLESIPGEASNNPLTELKMLCNKVYSN